MLLPPGTQMGGALSSHARDTLELLGLVGRSPAGDPAGLEQGHRPLGCVCGQGWGWAAHPGHQPRPLCDPRGCTCEKTGCIRGVQTQGQGQCWGRVGSSLARIKPSLSPESGLSLCLGRSKTTDVLCFRSVPLGSHHPLSLEEREGAGEDGSAVHGAERTSAGPAPLPSHECFPDAPIQLPGLLPSPSPPPPPRSHALFPYCSRWSALAT